MKITPSEELYLNRKAYWLPEHKIRELEFIHDISIERTQSSFDIESIGIIGKAILGVSSLILFGDIAGSLGLLDIGSPSHLLLSSLQDTWSYLHSTLFPAFFSLVKQLSLVTMFGSAALLGVQCGKELIIKINNKVIMPTNKKR